MRVLVIKDDKPGHYNQTEGLILYLKDIFENLEIEYIEIEIKSKLKRKILRILLNTFPNLFTENSIKYLPFFYKKFDTPKNKPDLIISTGGNTSNLNVWFSKIYKCKNILNGALRGLKEELFTYITTVIDLGYKNQIILDVAPSVVTKEKLRIKSKEFIDLTNLDSNQKYYTLLIGGNGAGYKYDNKFYDNLINFVKKTSKKKRIKWLNTTSRRTPLDIESKLEKELKDYYSYFVAYNKKEEKILLAFLGLCTSVFVTEESSSMISEAISSSKKVYTIGNEYSKSDKNYKNILMKFEVNKQIIRLNNFDLEEKKIKFNNININGNFKVFIRNNFE